MILLPSASPASLKGFGLVLALIGGVIVGGLSALWGRAFPVSAGLLTTGVLASASVLWPQIVFLPYRIWRRLARELAYWASAFLMALCFYVIFVAVGRAGTRLNLARPTPTQSLWTPRRALARSSYGSQHTGTTKSSSELWLPTFLSWAVQSSNFWAMCLSPFLLLLAGLETEQEESVSTDLYTLF